MTPDQMRGLARLGDLILYRVTKETDWESTAVGIGERLTRDHRQGLPSYCHAALVSFPSPQGVVMKIEQTWPRCREVAADFERPGAELWRPTGSNGKDFPEDIRRSAVVTAGRRIGEFYGIANLLTAGVWISRKGHNQVCSQLIDDSYTEVGWPLGRSNAGSRIVSPDDLAASKMLRRIA